MQKLAQEHNIKKPEEAARELANSFAGERVPPALEQLHQTLIKENGEFEWSSIEVNKIIGRLISTAYFKGYMDRANNNKLQKLYL
jgi:hypothetical protein